MMETIYEKKLDEVILNQLSEIDTLTPLDEKDPRFANVTNLLAKSIELKKINMDYQSKSEQISADLLKNDRNIETEKQIEKAKLIFDVTLKGIGLVTFVMGLIYVTEFEKDDTYTFTLSKILSKDILKFIRL